MKKLTITLTTLAASATLCLAQDAAGAAGGGEKGGKGSKGGARGNPEEAFKKLDTSGDGNVTLAEFKAGPMGQRNPDKVDERFKKLDANSDGNVTLEEFKAGRAGGRGGKKGGAGEKGGNQ